MKKVVIGLPGGMDSTTLLGLLFNPKSKYDNIHCCRFSYGSTHNQYENEAAKNIIKFYQYLNGNCRVSDHFIDISSVMKGFQSHLLLSSAGEIPEGHYNDKSMKKTVVPGRNLIFASVLAGLAESIGAQEIALGIHQGDHHIYPDCRKEFAKALDTLIYLSSDRKVEVLAPFIEKNKESILRIGYSLNIPVPYDLTRTCYKNQPLSCGKCGSCIERIEAFQRIGKTDPIAYEKGF